MFCLKDLKIFRMNRKHSSQRTGYLTHTWRSIFSLVRLVGKTHSLNFNVTYIHLHGNNADINDLVILRQKSFMNQVTIELWSTWDNLIINVLI